MEQYIEKDGKRLRLGYTTGSCAAAAAKAAAWMLLTGKPKEKISIQTPKGIPLILEVKEISIEGSRVSCAIEKDSGDDPDVTKGMLIFASVSYVEKLGISIDGGQGIGRVTKPGLDQPVGAEYVLLTPGNYGYDFIRDSLHIDPEKAVMTSNFIGDALDICKGLGFKGVLLVGHIGKLVKLAGGMFNTHSQYGDCRMEILTAQAALCGIHAKRAAEIMNAAVCDDALRVLSGENILKEIMERLAQRIGYYLRIRAGSDMETGTAFFSKVYGLLGKTENTDDLIDKIRKG